MRVLLAEDAFQHVGAGDLLLARRTARGRPPAAARAGSRASVSWVSRPSSSARRDRDLDGVLPGRRAGDWRIGAIALSTAGGRVVEQRQQVLDRHELVPRLAGALVADGELRVFAEHGGGTLLATARPAPTTWTTRAAARQFAVQAFFHRAQQWVLVHAPNIRSPARPWIRRSSPGEHPHTPPAGMHVQHHLGGAFFGHREEAHQHHDHEIHPGV